MKLKKGDTVRGDHRQGQGQGGRGRLRLSRKPNKVIVNGVNIAKKHQKARRRQPTQGGIIDRDMPHRRAATCMLVHKGKPTRVGYKIERRRHQGARRQRARGGDLA